MDTTQTITHLGLCAGYGGIELGLKRVIPTLRSVAFCEIEAFAIANLVAKMEAGLMDAAPIWTDLKTFPWAEFRDRVDILTGGYPCQPFSAAGKRLGKDDPRHLWPWIANGIRIMRPRVCFFENVEGHVSLGLEQVIEELGVLGFEAVWGIFSAAEVGAPHSRKRVFILAHSISQRGCSGNPKWKNAMDAITSCANGMRDETPGRSFIWPSRPGEDQRGWEPPRVAAINVKRSRVTEPSVGGDVDGTASGMGYAQLCVSCDNRTDELRLLGNGVVPATAERAFRVLWEELNQ